MIVMDLEQFFPFSNLTDNEFIDFIRSDNHKYPLSVLNSLTYCNSESDRTNHNVHHLDEQLIPIPECECIHLLL